MLLSRCFRCVMEFHMLLLSYVFRMTTHEALELKDKKMSMCKYLQAF